MRLQKIQFKNRLNGVLNLRPVNDGVPIRKLIVNQVERTSTYYIHPGSEKDLTRYIKGLVEHAGFFKIEHGNTITISQV